MTLNCNPLSMQCKYWQSTAADNDDVVVVVVNADIHCVFSSTSFITNDNVLTNEQKKNGYRHICHFPMGNNFQLNACIIKKHTKKKASKSIRLSPKVLAKQKHLGVRIKYIYVFSLWKNQSIFIFFFFFNWFLKWNETEKKKEKKEMERFPSRPCIIHHVWPVWKLHVDLR